MDQRRSFKTLKVWQDAMTLVEEIYKATSRFPATERFGLTAQIREASISIPSNIGEGARRRRYRRVYLHHLDTALGSQGEVEVQLELASRLGFVAASDYARLLARVEEVGRMLQGLIASIESRG
jgi:four helix bundle protein